jgi:Skp family chaperone for outer membrane proteins
LFDRNFFSQLEDERNDTETRLEKMSRDMEGVYQSKVTEKLQKLEESKQNVNKILFESMIKIFFFYLGFKNSRNISIKYSTRRRTSSIKT